jgi:hypothetical protein
MTAETKADRWRARAAHALILTLIGRIEARITDTTGEVAKTRFETILTLLRLAAWYAAAPALPKLWTVATSHEAGSAAEVARYAALHGTEPYAPERIQAGLHPIADIDPTYIPVSIRYNEPLTGTRSATSEDVDQ